MRNIKTLVIHPSDETTDFLKRIYINTDFVIISENISNSKKRELLKNSERIIMLGHGSKDGLFGYERLIIDSNDIVNLRNKEIIAIWCNADEFMKKYKLNGFCTGMFISEIEEAYYEGITCLDKKELEFSNNNFSEILSKHLFSDNILECVKKEYTSKDNRIIKFNSERLHKF